MESFAKMKATLKEIAEAASVNVSTASRALSGSYGVSQETREKVLSTAKKLGYRPNLTARGLVTGKSHTIGLLVSDIRNPYFAEVARGVEDTAFEAGFDVILCNSDLKPAKQVKYLHSLLEKNVDGILMNSTAALTTEQCSELASYGVPVTLLNRPAGKYPFSTVLGDNYEGGRLAGQYLFDLGHRSVAHLTGPRSHGNFADRSRGFSSVWQSQRDTVGPIVIRGDHSFQGGYEIARTLFQKHPEVTAVFAANDVIALGVLRAAAETGRSIPGDLSVIGFDNLEFTALVHPALTTIHQPKYEMGRAAVEILLRQIRAKAAPLPEHQVFGVTLIERNSCCKRLLKSTSFSVGAREIA